MRRIGHWLMVAGMLVGVSVAALAADQVVSLYVGGKLVKCEPAARVRAGMAYAPLRATSEAVGMHVTWEAVNRTASLCAPGRCVLPIKANQGIMVNNGLLIPVRLLGQSLGRPVTWDAKARAVRVQ
ncbi:MAG: copper amine oxidase N-terminal domain-containing protein [Armatimonadota bacterium]